MARQRPTEMRRIPQRRGNTWAYRGRLGGLCTALIAVGLGRVAAADGNVIPSSIPEHLVVVEDMLYFSADDGIHGRELWRCDVEGNSELAVDLWPGPKGSQPEPRRVVDHWLYFVAETLGTGRELFLWDHRTNTAAMLNCSAPGLASANPFFLGVGKGQCYIAAQEIGPWPHLWVGAVGEDELRRCFELFPGPLPGAGLRSTVAHDGALYYYDADRLRRTDGTAKEPFAVVGFFEKSDIFVVGAVEAFGEAVIFVGLDEEHGRELWVTDGTPANTMMVKDILPGPGHSGIGAFHLHEGALYFTAGDGVHGRELWRTDGTPEETTLVSDINPGTPDSEPHYFASHGPWLYFLAADGRHGKELWRTDGTPEATSLVADLYAGAQGSDPWRLTPFGERLYLCADSDVYGEEVFFIEGTAPHVHILMDIAPGSGGSGPHQLTDLDGTLFFTCDDGIHGEELWLSDGTEEGTRLAADIYPLRYNPSSSPRELTALGDLLLFVVSEPAHGQELWVSDGTEQGTHILADIAPGSNNAEPRDVTSAGGLAFFTAQTEESGRELWCTDGTQEGTGLVRDIRPGPDGADPRQLTAHQGTLYFTADDGVHGRELWLSDGSGKGTVAVGDETSGPGGSSILALVSLPDGLYVFAGESDSSIHVWRAPVPRDVGMGPSGAAQSAAALNADQAVLAEMLCPALHEGGVGPAPVRSPKAFYFVHYTVRHGAELWTTDGTRDGTAMVCDVYPGRGSASPADLVVLEENVFFIANHPTHGRVVWQSDGSVPGTNVVAVQALGGPGPVLAQALGRAGNRLVVVNPSRVAEQGFEEVPLTFITPRADGGFGATSYALRCQKGATPAHLTAAGDRLFFTHDDGIHGEELWVTDGTPEGTRLGRDILPPAEAQ